MQHHAPKEYNNPKSSIVTIATTPYIKGASETIARMYYNPNKKKRVAHKPITTLQRLRTTIKAKTNPKTDRE